MEFRDLKQQYRQLKPAIDETMMAVAASGGFIMGSPVKELEEELAGYVGVKYCLTCGNGTDALTLALKAIGVGAGDAVFVPDFTFFASAEVIALEGATPIFVDIDSRTFNIDCKSLADAIAAVKSEGKLRPRAIIAVDLFGLPANFVELQQIARLEGLLLIEDGAQGFGGAIGSRRACSFGDIATTSFFPAKPLGCYGDGGAVFTDNDDWAKLIESYRVHGKGSDKYDNVRIGINSRLDTLQAAILRVKLEAFINHELDDVNMAAKRYSQMLAPLHDKLRTPVTPQGYTSRWAQYTIVLADGIDRSGVQSEMKGQGIPTMVYYPKTMSQQTAFSGLHQYTETPMAQHLAQRVLSLPMHPYLEECEQATAVAALSKCLNRATL